VDITFLGAVDAIGGNKFLLSDRKDPESRILLDFGMMFGDPESYVKSGGGVGSMGAFYDEFLQPRRNAGLRDLLRLKILPEVEGLYRKDWLVTPEYRRAVERHLGEVPLADFWEAGLDSYEDHVTRTGRPFVDGVLITHAHADHFQHLAYVDHRVPVFATAVTRSIVQSAADVANAGEVQESVAARLRHLEANGAKSKWPGFWGFAKKAGSGKRDWHAVQPYEWFQVGAFRVQAIPIDHSVPGACFFLIEGSDGKRVLYTGDFRFHGVYEGLSDHAKRLLADSQVDALLCEGTRIDNDHIVREADVRAKTTARIRDTRGLVFAEWGWKDATRFLTMQQAAEAAGRTLLVDPRVAYMLQGLSRVDRDFRPIEGYPNVRVYLRRKSSLLYAPQDYDKHELGYQVEWSKEDAAEAMRFLSSEDGLEAPPTLAHYTQGVRADQVRKDPSRYIVQSSFFQMGELFDLQPPQGSYYIKSSCEPFNDEMKSDQKKQLNWLSNFGVDSNLAENRDGHHTSGHASGAELAEFWRIVKPRLLFPIHTIHAERYAEHWRGDIHVPRYGETFRV
jgi:ribonuclease J